MPKITIKSLQNEIIELKAIAERRSAMVRDANDAKNEAVAREKDTREQFADLKKRLHNSEMEVARLNGYLARVREDDVVREDLVTVGEPGGEQRMLRPQSLLLSAAVENISKYLLHSATSHVRC